MDCTGGRAVGSAGPELERQAPVAYLAQPSTARSQPAGAEASLPQGRLPEPCPRPASSSSPAWLSMGRRVGSRSRTPTRSRVALGRPTVRRISEHGVCLEAFAINSVTISAARSARPSRCHTPRTSRTSSRPISAVDGLHGKVWLYVGEPTERASTGVLRLVIGVEPSCRLGARPAPAEEPQGRAGPSTAARTVGRGGRPAPRQLPFPAGWLGRSSAQPTDPPRTF